MRSGIALLASICTVLFATTSLAFDESDLIKIRELNQCINCDLRKANLANADLSGSQLSGADLRESDLHNANLSGAILNYAKLRKANLKQKNHFS